MAYDSWGNLFSGLFANPATGLGTKEDSKTHTRVVPYFPISQDVLESLYLKSGFIEKIVSIPALDFIRNGFDIVETNDVPIKDIVIKELERLDFSSQLYKLKLYSRLYGKAYMIAVTDTRYGDSVYEEPLSPETIQTIKRFNVVSPDKLYPSARNYDFTTEDYLTSEYYQGYGSKRIHKSYVFTMDNSGLLDSSYLETNDSSCPSGSVVERLIQPHKNYETQHSAVASKMQSFTLIWRKVSDLVEKSTGKNKDKWLDSFKTQQLLQSVLRVTLIDSADDIGQLSANMGGIAAILDTASDALFLHTDVPKILITGDMPGGLSNGLEGVLEPYYNKIGAEQKMQATPIITRLANLIAGYKLQNYAPEFQIRFNPLWQLSDTDISEMRHRYAETFKIYTELNALTSQEVRDSVFGSIGWNTEVNLDTATLS